MTFCRTDVDIMLNVVICHTHSSSTSKRTGATAAPAERKTYTLENISLIIESYVLHNA